MRYKYKHHLRPIDLVMEVIVMSSLQLIGASQVSTCMGL
jgi:hypothetical protein